MTDAPVLAVLQCIKSQPDGSAEALLKRRTNCSGLPGLIGIFQLGQILLFICIQRFTQRTGARTSSALFWLYTGSP